MWRCSLIVISWGLLCFISLQTIATGEPQHLARDEKQIDSASGKKGVISSPQYPRTSGVRQDRTFIFSAKPQELVRIIFHEFDLPQLGPGKKCGRNNAYLSYTRQQSEESVFICNYGRLPMPILAETPDFVLEYTMPADLDPNGTFRGFNATYEFLTNFGINTGAQSGPNECYFEYSVSTGEKGTVTSPNFPGFYPAGLECTYMFHGGEGNLTLTFTEFNLLGFTNRCSDDSDEVEITDSSKKFKDYFREGRCGQYENGFKVSVNSSSVTLLFRSLENELSLDPSQKFVGFNATYEFSAPPSTPSPSSAQGGAGLGSTLHAVLGLSGLVLASKGWF